MAFEPPNTTPTPNELFDKYMALMGNAEFRVVCAIIRQTLGWTDRKGNRYIQAKISMRELRDKTGLSENGVIAGAKAAEVRGLLKRLNPNDKTKAEWLLLFDLPPSASEGGRQKISLSRRGRNPQPVREEPSASEGQVGTKKRIKKENKKSASPAIGRDAPKPKTIRHRYQNGRMIHEEITT